MLLDADSFYLLIGAYTHTLVFSLYPVTPIIMKTNKKQYSITRNTDLSRGTDLKRLAVKS